MPSCLEPIAAANPFTTMVNAARALFVGTPAGNAPEFVAHYLAEDGSLLAAAANRPA